MKNATNRSSADELKSTITLEQDTLKKLQKIYNMLSSIDIESADDFDKAIHKACSDLSDLHDDVTKKSQQADQDALEDIVSKIISLQDNEDFNTSQIHEVLLESIKDYVQPQQRKTRPTGSIKLSDELDQKLIDLLNEAKIPKKNQNSILGLVHLEAENARKAELSSHLKPLEKAPALWKPRSENPLDFIQRVYGEYIEAGVLTLEQLRKLDRRLVNAADTMITKKSLDKKVLLPPTKTDVQQQKENYYISLFGEEFCNDFFATMNARHRREYRKKSPSEKSLDIS